MIFFAELPKIEEIFADFKKLGYDWKYTRSALRQAAELGIAEWRDILAKPNDKNAKYFARKYAEGLQVLGAQNRSVKFGVSDKFAGLANVVEKGRGPYKIWNGMAKSPRLRRGKNGPYMIVAFRHGMASVKQHGLSEQFGALKEYTKVGSKREKNAHGSMVSRNVYSYSSEGFGKRISVAGRPGFEPRPGHKSHIMEGLTKAVQHQKGGSVSMSAITFRVIKANSPGWIFPSIKPQNIRQQVMNRLTGNPRFLEIIRQGIGQDMIASRSM